MVTPTKTDDESISEAETFIKSIAIDYKMPTMKEYDAARPSSYLNSEKLKLVYRGWKKLAAKLELEIQYPRRDYSSATKEQVFSRIKELSINNQMVKEAEWNKRRGEGFHLAKHVKKKLKMTWGEIATKLKLKPNKRGPAPGDRTHYEQWKFDDRREAEALKRLRIEMSTPLPIVKPDPNPEFINPSFIEEEHSHARREGRNKGH